LTVEKVTVYFNRLKQLLFLTMDFNQKIRPKKFTSIILAIILLAFFVLAGILLTPLMLDFVKHPDRLRQLVLNAGIWAPLVMVIMQIIQVIIAPMPGQVVAFISGYIFGAFKGTVLSMIGLTIGAIIAFLLARMTGRKLLRYFLHEAALNRLDTYTLKQGPFVLFLLLLIPNPLGDGVYYLAGLTNIPLLFYIILVMISRFPSNVVNNLIGAKVTSFNIYHWLVFGLTIVILALLYYLYNNRIEEILLRFAKIKDPAKPR
jgi:uncharacterized membrane protein YdjX (TVP38/TMEM64 family)